MSLNIISSKGKTDFPMAVFFKVVPFFFGDGLWLTLLQNILMPQMISILRMTYKGNLLSLLKFLLAIKY